MFRKLIKALIPRDMFRSIEPTGHFFEALMWQMLLGWPARGLKIIGVTGTNGKTSTSYMIQRMLHEAGYKVGLMSTVGYGVGLDIKPQVTHMTTSSTKVTLERIKQLRGQGMEWLVLETTSHALAQNRVWGIPYGLAVMTNITHEHLEYHRTFERYLDAKVKLFRMVAANRGGRRLGVVNADDPNAPYFLAAVPESLTYGVHAEADVRAKDMKSEPDGNEYRVVYKDRELHIRTQLPGSFNVDNSLAAVSVGLALGLDNQQIERGVAALESVEGRMTRIDEGQDYSVIVDYAHSPDSFEKLFADVRPMVQGRMIVIFGSQGSTGDVAKRGVQGRLAGESADAVVVTEEDDRGEDGKHIMNQIAEGAEKAGKVREQDLWLIHNRTDAIRFGVGMAHKGDVVLILGKGHEKTIEREKDGEEPWDEPGEARAAIKLREAR